MIRSTSTMSANPAAMTAGFADGGSVRMLRLGNPVDHSDFPVPLNDFLPP